MKTPIGDPPRVVFEKYGKGVFWQTYTMPDGHSEDFLIYGNQKQVTPSIFMPVTSDRQVIAIRQFRYGANTVLMELPGGCPKPGQNPEEVVADELHEETGYRPGKIIRLNKQLWFEPASLRVTYIPFLLLDCVLEGKSRLDASECIEVVKMPLQEWIDLVQSGAIEDDKTIAITFLAMRHLK